MNSTRRLLALVTAILANILWFAPYLGFGKDLTGAFMESNGIESKGKEANGLK